MVSQNNNEEAIVKDIGKKEKGDFKPPVLKVATGNQKLR